MDKYFISLERTPERTARFLSANAHVPNLVHAPGIDGSNMDVKAMSDLGLVHTACSFTRGAIGSGLTHIALWGSVAKSGKPAHIFEDDAFLCQNFDEESDRVLSMAGEDWDIVLWGNNPDTVLKFYVLPNITPCTTTFSQEEVRRNIVNFAQETVKSNPFSLEYTFGICGYAISPKGAKKMLEKCLPLRGENVFYDAWGGRTIAASSLDHLMNIFYREMRAFTSFPPLCLTDNLTEKSLNA